MKLSKTQQELYDNMKAAGAICIYMPYTGRFRPNAYYFRTSDHKRCTAAAEALFKKGLLEKFDRSTIGGDRGLRLIAAKEAK